MVNTIPKFQLKFDKADISTHVRISQIENGFVVKTGETPIHYQTIEDAAEAIAAGLKALKWSKPEKKAGKS